MAGQTTVNGSAAHAAGTASSGRPETVLGGVGAFGANVTNLAHLQVRLLLLDLQEGSTRAKLYFAAIGLAMIIIPGGLVLLLAGIALWVAEATSLTTAQAMVLVPFIAILLAALAAFIGARGVRTSYTTFRRSNEEFQRNLAWLKTVLSQSGRS
jgi:uncharacterized membrane protein YqjE